MVGKPRIVNRDDVVLVVVDIQERLAVTMEHRDRVVAATSKLIKTAALLKWPIIETRQNPNGLGDTVAEIREMLESPEIADATEVHRVDKMTFCCCGEPEFGNVLGGSGRTQVVLTGMETHVCVSQTALVLDASGLTTFVAADACCSQRDSDAKIALQRMRRDGVVVTTSEPIMYEAVRQAGTDEFRAMLRIVKGQ